MNPTQNHLLGSRKTFKTKFPPPLRNLVGALCVLALCLGAASCKKREPVDTSGAGGLRFAPAKFADAVPDDYGPLIGVTQNPTDPAWVGLWFQKPDRTITAVFVNINEGTIYGKTLTIPRK